MYEHRDTNLVRVTVLYGRRGHFTFGDLIFCGIISSLQIYIIIL